MQLLLLSVKGIYKSLGDVGKVEQRRANKKEQRVTFVGQRLEQPGSDRENSSKSSQIGGRHEWYHDIFR